MYMYQQQFINYIYHYHSLVTCFKSISRIYQQKLSQPQIIKIIITVKSMSNSVNQNNFLGKFAEVYPQSSEWSLIEYKLQMSLGSTSAIIKKIWNVNSPQLSSNFQKKNKGTLILDSFTEISSLDQNNRIEKVCKKGFEFPLGGLNFSTGFMKVNHTQGKSCQFLLSKIAVGKSFCIPKNSSKERTKLPNGFDSLYIYNEEENLQIFRHEYVLFQQLQVLPAFIVHFQFDIQREQSLKPPLCDACGDNIAKIYCLVEQAHFCPDCDNDNHKTRLTSKHNRVDINDKPKGFGNCIDHPEVKQELFCSVCNLPLCINCKISGSHMSGQMATHHVTRIKDAYAAVSERVNEMDPNLQKRKNQLSELLGNIDLKIKEVNKNATLVEQQIYMILQAALKELQENTQKKMSYLIGDQLELKRQYDYIQWMQSFLKYEQKILLPSEFLSAWSKHTKLRKEVLNLSNIPIVTDVKADLKVEGKIRVITQSLTRNLPPAEILGQINLLADRSGINNKENYMETTPLKNEKERFEQIGSTPFRRNIFSKHIDKNSQLIKAGMSTSIKNLIPEAESPIRKNNLKLTAFKDESGFR